MRVWVPDEHAGARVAYTVSDGPQVQTFQLSQETTNGWYALPGAFSASPLTLRMTYLRPSTTASGGPCQACDAMAAAQVRFDFG